MLFVRDKGNIQQLTVEQIRSLREFNKLGTFAEVSEDGINWTPVGDVAELNPMPPQQLLPEEPVQEFVQPVHDWPQESNPYEGPEASSSPPSAAEWYYALGEQQLGPYSIQQMQQFIVNSVLSRGMLVFSGTHSDQWVPVESVPEFIYFLQNNGVQNSGIQTSQTKLEAHRGGMILTFGLIGLLAFWPLAIPAWIMGSGDLKKMKSGVMDPDGKGMTTAGYIMGMITCILLILAFVSFCLWIGVAVSLAGGAGAF